MYTRIPDICIIWNFKLMILIDSGITVFKIIHYLLINSHKQLINCIFKYQRDRKDYIKICGTTNPTEYNFILPIYFN